ncbi:hypothetical protein [Rhizobium sp. LC145]|uniref:hypothetical protein n=1 Tax=Rhizobium sp. LC145 TaxID=1120688 RepID=UPI00062A3320|nr:hypothetical protein [Rhizobium sp. LC145]KKX29204.1 hypothetical protein YH62_15500 [Rhizobium sp. LC145]TKT68806.1 hypothetical protein FDR95_00035 [Rhizobiaceae bacterium LC148]
MTFSEAYALHGPDTIAISEALGIPEHEADRLVNERMEQKARRRADNARLRAELREIRAKRPA